jgi:hypothetical protein
MTGLKKEYWKITELKKTLEIEKEQGFDCKVTMDESKNIETQIKLMQEAQDFKEKEMFDDFKKMIESIDTQIPDDDGEPVDLTVEDFKEKLKKKIQEI